MNRITFATLVVLASAVSFSIPPYYQTQIELWGDENETMVPPDFLARRVRNSMLGHFRSCSITDINAYIDTILKYMANFALSYGYDPYKLKDIIKQRETWIATIRLHMYQIRLYGISKLFRKGNAVLIENGTSGIYLKATIGVRPMKVTAKFKTQAGMLHPSGSMKLSIKNVKVRIGTTVNLLAYPRIKLHEVKLVDTKRIEIDLTLDVHVLVNWLLNGIISLVFYICHNIIITKAFDVIKAMVYKVIEDINKP